MSVRALAAAAVALALTGCGGGGGKAASGGLSWVGTPQVFQPRTLPRDRVVIARVRNSSKRTLHIVAARVVVRDAGGRALRGSSAAFTTTFAHGLFGAYQQPKQLPTSELLRLGKLIYLPPGAKAPFYAAWHLPPGAKEPVRVDYGAGALVVPSAFRPAAR